MKRMRLCYDMLSLISKPGSKGPKDPKATKTNTPLLSVCIADLCWSLRRSRVSNTIPRAASPSWALPLPRAPRSGWSWWPQPRTELPAVSRQSCSTTKMATQQDCWHLTLFKFVSKVQDVRSVNMIQHYFIPHKKTMEPFLGWVLFIALGEFVSGFTGRFLFVNGRLSLWNFHYSQLTHDYDWCYTMPLLREAALEIALL